MEGGLGIPLGLRLRQGSPGCPRGPGGDSPEPSGTDTGDIFGLDVPYYFLYPTERRQAGEVSAVHGQYHFSHWLLSAPSLQTVSSERTLGPQDSSQPPTPSPDSPCPDHLGFCPPPPPLGSATPPRQPLLRQPFEESWA